MSEPSSPFQYSSPLGVLRALNTPLNILAVCVPLGSLAWSHSPGHHRHPCLPSDTQIYLLPPSSFPFPSPTNLLPLGLCPLLSTPSQQPICSPLLKSVSHSRTCAGLERAVCVAQHEVRLPIQLLQPPHAGMGYRCVPPHLGPDTASDAPAYPVSYQDVPASPLQIASSPSPAPSSAFPLLACILVNDVLGVPSSLSSRLACKHPPLPPFLAVPFSASVHLLFYLRLRAQAEFGCSTNGYDRFSTVRIPPLNCSFSLSSVKCKLLSISCTGLCVSSLLPWLTLLLTLS